MRIRDSGVENLAPWFAMELLGPRTVHELCGRLWLAHGGRVERTTLIESESEGPLVDEPIGHLEQRVPAAGRRLTDVLSLMSQVSAALAYVHGEGLVHRDLKPQNIFLRADGTPVLADFGLTVWFGGAAGGERLDTAKAHAGTIPFMPPEVIRGELADARADLYSLGCIFYLLVTGSLPFVGADDHAVRRMHLERPPPRPSELVDDLPRHIEHLILRLLAKAPEDRIGHAQDVVDELAPFLPDASVVPGAPRASRFYLYRPRVSGRDDLRAEIAAHLDRLKAGRGGLILLGGESGAGKTFLCNDLAASADKLRITVLTGECDQLGTPSGVADGDERSGPLHPFRRFFRAVADRCHAGGAAVTSRLIGNRGPTLARYHPAFAELNGARPSGGTSRPEQLDGEEARSAAIEAVAATLKALAAETPLLLILDDLQWADALSLDVLRFLTADFLAARPLLIVGTYRADEVGKDLAELLERTDLRHLRLGRLGRAAVGAQVRDMLAIAAAPEALVDFLESNSEGLPLFIAEYLRSAVEKQLVRREKGRWVVSETGRSLDVLATALDLPRSLRGLLSDRLARLSPSARDVSVVAAVLGRELDARLLAETAAADADELLAACAELIQRQILEQPSPGAYRFVHDKVRETVYEEAPADRLRDVHGRAAITIERQGDHPEQYPALARHFRVSGDRANALRYSRLAGKWAWTSGSFQDAREHLSRALELSPTKNVQDATPKHRLEEGQTRHWLASSLFCSGELDKAMERFDESLVWLGRAPLPRRRIGWLGLIASLAVRQVGHRYLPRRVYAIPAGIDREMAAEAAQIAIRLSWCFAFRFRLPQMLAAVLLGANLSDRSSAQGPSAAAHSALGSFLGHLGLHGVAERYFERARRAVPAGDALALVREAQSECVFYLNQGRWDALQARGGEALTHAVALGATHETEALAQALSTASTLTGKIAQGERDARSLAETAARLGHRLQHGWGMLTVAAAIFRQGDFGEVMTLLSDVERSCRDREDVVSQLECLAFMAAAAQRMGITGLAIELAERAEATAAHVTAPGASSATRSTGCWPACTSPSRGGRLGRRRSDAASAGCSNGLAAAARASPACAPWRALALLHRGWSHELGGRSAKAVAAFLRSRDQAIALGMPFDEALAEVELARAEALPTPERNAHEARARELLDRLGCRHYAGETWSLA